MRAKLTLLGIAIIATVPCVAQEPQTNEELQAIRKMLEAQSSEIHELSKQIQALQATIQERTHAPSSPTVNAEPEEKPIESAKATDSAATHTVAKGETLTSIARKYGVNVAELLKLNKITDDRKLQIGQALAIPQQAAESPKPND